MTDADTLPKFETEDHHAVRGNVRCAGVHLLADFNGVEFGRLDSPEAIESTLKAAALEAGATILFGHFHHFKPNGVTGVLVLAESHISIHTWPDSGFAALDVFMCR